jgi:hypothetical protein
MAIIIISKWQTFDFEFKILDLLFATRGCRVSYTKFGVKK